MLLVLFVIVLIIILLRYKPPYNISAPTPAQKQVTPYLTHELLPQLYNGIQLQVPFDLIITQQGINDVIAFSRWQDTAFAAPAVLFVPDRILLISQTAVGKTEFVITVELRPVFNKQHLLNLRLTKVLVGAVNITPLGRLIARQMYAGTADLRHIDPNDIRAKLVASLLDNQPFDPILAFDDKKARIDKITITDGSLTLHFAPVLDSSNAVNLKY